MLKKSLSLGLMLAMILTGVVVASEVDIAVVDIEIPINSVTLEPGEFHPIVITATVTGKQVGEATFQVYRDWTLSGGVFNGSNPVTGTVGPRAGGAAPTTFEWAGTVTVAAGQGEGTFKLAVGAFDIWNEPGTTANLEAGDSSAYDVVVEDTALPPVDDTPPVITYELNPAAPDGHNNWYVNDVTVTWTVEDEESEVTSTTGCDETTINTDTTGVTLTCEATSAGGTSSESVTIKRDATDPVVSLVGGPDDGGVYYYGFVPAAPTCEASDATSGLVGPCSVDGYGDSIGGHTVTASATDMAGNSGSDSAAYTVLKWDLYGFYQPVDMDGVFNTVKGGSTVPLKFNVFAGTELTDTAAVKSLIYKPISCDTGTNGETPIEQIATGGTSLRYDWVEGQFVFNWKTPKQSGCFQAIMTTLDGSTLVANFKLK